MGRAAARDHDGWRAGAVADQHGRRTWRRTGPLQPARRGRDRLRVRLVGGGIGRSSRSVSVFVPDAVKPIAGGSRSSLFSAIVNFVFNKTTGIIRNLQGQ